MGQLLSSSSVMKNEHQQRRTETRSVLTPLLASVLVDIVLAYDYRRLGSTCRKIAGTGKSGKSRGKLQFPMGVAVDEQFVYIADMDNGRVQVVNKNDGTVRRTLDGLETPCGLAIYDDLIYVAEYDAKRIRVITKLGQSLDYYEVGWQPCDLACKDGKIYVVNINEHRVEVLDSNGGKRLHIISAEKGSPGFITVPSDVAVEGKDVFVVDRNISGQNGAVKVFDEAGQFKRQFGEANLMDPGGVAVDGAEVYVTDATTQSVQVFDRMTGSFIRSHKNTGASLEKREHFSPAGIEVYEDEIFVTDHKNHMVWGFS